MKILINGLISCAFLFSVACSSPTQTVYREVAPVKESEIIELTVYNGKTTKKEIIDALGTPDSFYDHNLSYRFEGDELLRLTVIQKDGTKFDVTLGKNQKKDHVTFWLWNKSKNIVEDVQI